MAFREIIAGRALRQRWLTGLVVLGVSITALAVGFTYWIGADRVTPQARISTSPGSDVKGVYSGYTFTRSNQGHPVFTVRAAHTVSYEASKATTLEDVTVEVFGRKGDRGDILRTKSCEYNSQSGNFVASGPVQIELSAHSSEIPGSGLHGKHRIILETSKVAYRQDEEIAETDEPVTFHMGVASGTAVGMIYATRDGWVKLKHNVVVDLVQGTEKAPQQPMHLTASALRYDKDAGHVALSGPVEVTQDKRRGVSKKAEIQLDAHNRVTKVNLDGHAKALDATDLRNIALGGERVQGDFDPSTGLLKHMTAQDSVTGESQGKSNTSHMTADRIDMDFGGKHPQPQQGLATGNVRMDLESQSVLNIPGKSSTTTGLEKKTLSAGEVQFGFRPDTHGLKDAKTEGPGTVVVVPADPKVGQKVITAGQFLMAFDQRSRIESLQGLGPTKVVFHPSANVPAGTNNQESKADRLDAMFDVGTQTLREVRQSGNFQYQDGDRQASSDEAHYDAQTQTMLLLGHPQVWDPNSRVRSQKMTIDMQTNTSIGEGKVQATHLPSPPPGKPAPTSPTLPTNVLADRMVAKRQSQIVHYEGHVRAWQGTDVVESSSLDVYRTQKRLTSGSQVSTSFLQPAGMLSGTGTGAQTTTAAHPVTIRADFLEYLDEGRRARYHGNVHLVTESTTVTSDRLDVYLTQGNTVEGSQVDHAMADGHVKVTQPGRLGTSDHADYIAAPGKIIMTGGPPILVDDEKGSTTGQRLTFFTHDDRLFVDGGDQKPSLSTHRVAP